MRVKKEYLSKLTDLGFEDDEIDFNGYWRSVNYDDDDKIDPDNDLEVEETYSYQGLHVLKKDGTIYTNKWTEGNYDGSCFDVYVQIPDILKNMILKGMVE